mgnify:CR=1 FL=1
MSNKKVLKFLEKNMEGLEKLEYFMKHEEALTYSDLIWELDIDGFKGYECLLPVMLMGSNDPALQRTWKRLFLQLYREKLQEIGAQELVKYVMQMLREEYSNWEKRQEKIDKM